ncbi:MAG: hypothetical protein F4Z08_06185 [Chloroflexi bacterium]|nr:hypothetical protein [Chloroflexota bacterium]
MTRRAQSPRPTLAATIASNRKQAAVRRMLIALIAALIGVAALGSAQPYGSGEPNTTPLELRVWQGLDDPTDIAIGARAPDGAWGDLAVVQLPLDDGFSAGGHYRYGQRTLEVPLTTAAPVGVEVWVWQATRVPDLLFVSARGVGGSWELVGTVRVHLDDGIRPDLGYRFGDIRIEVDLPEPQVVTLAGSAMQWGYVDGVGSDARFGGPRQVWVTGLDVDADGSVVLVNYYNSGVRRIAPDGTVTTIAGDNGNGFRDGPADVAQFWGPSDVAIAPDGSIYVADRLNRRIRRVTPDGMVTTVAGTGPSGHAVDVPPRRDGRADEAVIDSPWPIALAPDGDLFFRDGPVIRRLSPSGWVSTFVGGSYGFADGHRRLARFGYVTGIDVDASGNLYVSEINDRVPGEVGRVGIIRKITPNGVVRTLYRDRHPAHRGGLLAEPYGIAVSDGGDIYIASTGCDQIMQLMPNGKLRAIAGTGEAGSFDGPYGTATFNFPSALALAPSGALIVSDQANSTVRAILPGPAGFTTHVPLADDKGLPYLEGVSVTRFAGRAGGSGYSGDGGPADRALFNAPGGIALDRSGGVLVADARNHAIRRISADGTVSTLAGGKGRGSRDGSRSEARFEYPRYVAMTGDGTIYVVDGKDRVRKIALDGTVSTVEWDATGNIHTMEQGPDGSVFISRDGRIWRPDPDGSFAPVGHRFGYMWGLHIADDGSFFFLDDIATNFWVTRFTAAGDVSTVFEDGRGLSGGWFSHRQHRLALGPDGAMYVLDPKYRQVVRISPDGPGAIVVDHEASGMQRFYPNDILVTPDGDLLVSDAWQHVIWRITIGESAGR